MRDMLKLFLAVVLFTAVSGGVLAAVRNATQERIEYQQLKFVKGPAIKKILEGCSNNPLSDRFKIRDGAGERNIFVGEFNGKRNTIAFESFGMGEGGPIGVMVAINLDTDKVVGVGVTTHKETPGLGSRIKTEPAFTAQFKGMPIKDPFKVKADGGKIDAISGATISSRGVCGAVMQSSEVYLRLKEKIIEKIKGLKG
ncbi:MAG: electron transporter RnfG [Deltaproteobacteria bacterium]|nr:MAG: electron transporter RnfG [Deltaproteobacteria bacterium]